MSGLRCAYCGNGHETRFCPKTWAGSVNLMHRRCTYCGSKEHSVKLCPKTWAGPAQRRALGYPPR